MTEVSFEKIARKMEGRESSSGASILFSIVALVAMLLYWASWAELDSVTRGEGRLISSVQNQVVQAAEGGVILERRISENSVVRANEILFVLDPLDANSELNRLDARLSALSIRKIRLLAEIEGTDLSIPQDLRIQSPDVARTEEDLHRARKDELEGSLRLVNHKLDQRRQDIAAAENERDTAIETSALLQEEVAIVEPLVEENIAPATRLLELQRQISQSSGARQAAEVKVDQARSALQELNTERENILQNFQLRAFDELNLVTSEMTELSEALPLLKERVSRTVVRAPMDGIVSRLNFRTVGGYVNTGDPVLEIVPTGEELIVESKIAPKDISRIAVGDDVRIRLSAYDSAKYGTVDGVVSRISADAVSDDRNNGLSYYVVDVKITGELVLEGSEIPVEFLPGMTATVDVLSGKRTVLEYFWQPIARVQELALRD